MGSKIYHISDIHSYQYEFQLIKVNLTLEQLAAQQRYSDYQRTVWHKLKQVDKSQIFDQKLHRQVQLMSNIGPSALPPDQLDRVRIIDHTIKWNDLL